MGRLLVFLARIAASHSGQIRGLGIDEQTAVLLEPDGHAMIVGKGAAYFLEAHGEASRLQVNVPLSFSNVSVQKVTAGGVFNLRAWKGGAQPYTLDVIAGAIHSSRPDGSIY
jgi:cyanophycinase-like exopeptidase